MKNCTINKKIVKNIFMSFFLPTVVSSVAISLISVTDMIIAGQILGERALAAISVVYPITLLIMICSSLFGIGSSISISIHLGEGDKEHCNRILTNTFIIASLVSVIISVIGIVFANPILRICGATDIDLLNNSKDYMLPILYGFIFMVFSPMMMTFLRCDSKPKESMIIVLSCGVINLILDYLFAGCFGFGLTGIAYASVIAETLVVIIGFWFFFVKGNTFSFVRPKLNLAELKEIIVSGLPVAMIFSLQAVLTAFINHVLMDCGGESGIAVYAVIKYLIGFIYALFDGVTGSMQPMLGIYYGEKEKENVIDTAKVSFRMMVTMSCLLFLFLELAAPFVCLLFGIKGELLEMATLAVRIQALFCIPAGIIACVNAFVRSTKNSYIAIILTLFDNCLFDIPLILMFKRILNNSFTCVFFGLVVTDLCTIILWLLIVIIKNKKGSAEGLLLLKDIERDFEPLFEHVFLLKDEDISSLPQKIEDACNDNEIPIKKSYYIALCVEEFTVNVINRASDKKDLYVDILLCRTADNNYSLRIRENLSEFDFTKTPDINPIDILNEDDDASDLFGIDMVKKLAKEYDYKRTIGLNNFRVVF